MIALIPARAGSVRVPGKNIRPLGGHPLIAYSIHAATRAPCIRGVSVSTDSDEIAAIAMRYGASVITRRPAHATATSPDLEWVREAIVAADSDRYALLRPTSPFRTSETIQRAYDLFQRSDADSLRAVEPVRQHPGKVWVVRSARRMVPLMPSWDGHSQPTATLPPVYVQNASLEMFHRRTILTLGCLSGHDICPFFTEGAEGIDINTEDDWSYAEFLVSSGRATLPTLDDS